MPGVLVPEVLANDGAPNRDFVPAGGPNEKPEADLPPAGGGTAGVVDANEEKIFFWPAGVDSG